MINEIMIYIMMIIELQYKNSEEICIINKTANWG